MRSNSVVEALRGGVDLLQLRAKAATTRERIRWSVALQELAAPFDVPVLVNDDVEAAARSGARGVHVGQRDASVNEARARLGEGAWIGVSTHNLEEAVAAWKAGATHLGMGCCFPSPTKPEASPLNHTEFRQTLVQVPLPVFAIGGIDAGNLAQLRVLGVRHVAVSSAVLDHENPTSAAADLLRQLL